MKYIAYRMRTLTTVVGSNSSSFKQAKEVMCEHIKNTLKPEKGKIEVVGEFETLAEAEKALKE